MIGWYIGAFSPPTIAHKIIVKEVLRSKLVSRVHVVPSSDFYTKYGLLAGWQRILLLQLCFGDVHNVVVDDHDLRFDHWPTIKESLDNFCISRGISLIDIAFILGQDKFSWMKQHDQQTLSWLNGCGRIFVAARTASFDQSACEFAFNKRPFVILDSRLPECSSTRLRQSSVFSDFAAETGIDWQFSKNMRPK